LGEQRTSRLAAAMSANDPLATWALKISCSAT
jgi:hypothetical protein